MCHAYTQLKQNVSAGNEISNNIIEDNRSQTKFQGQIFVNSATASEKQIDVTDFVKSQSDGYASFIIVQEHRWTSRNQLNSNVGDTQADGVRVVSKATPALAPALKVFP